MTYEEAHEHLIIKNGDLWWRIASGRRRDDRPVGVIDSSNGYRRFSFRNQRYYAHRVIFFMTHGYWPGFVDHIDRDRTNNDPSNLREVTPSQSIMNTKNRKNTYGRGICKHEGRKKPWQAKIGIGGRNKSLGYYETLEEAHAARRRGEMKYHGEYAHSAG